MNSRVLLRSSAALVAIFGLLGATSTHADIVLTTSSSDSADLDFDGSGTETNGDLGINSLTFTLTGSELPSDPEFANILSMGITFSAPSGFTLTSIGSGISPFGIGMTSPGEFAPSAVELNAGEGEVLTISVSSTSSVPGQQVVLSGVAMNDWRNFFPVSELTLTGATFDGGQSVLTGGGGVSGPIPDLVFDSGVSSFSLESTGGDGIRLSSLRFAVTNAVPEPSTALFVAPTVAGLFLRRRSRTRVA